jgi:hypothetical protein
VRGRRVITVSEHEEQCSRTKTSPQGFVKLRRQIA